MHAPGALQNLAVGLVFKVSELKIRTLNLFDGLCK